MFITHRRRLPKDNQGFISTPNSRSTLQELWSARYLIRQLIIRDLTVRYRDTWLGGLWAVLSPAFMLGMYYTMFGLMVKVSTPDYMAPYVLVLLSGLVFWGFFQSLVNATGDSLLNNLPLIKKIYFPRSALTISCAGISLVDFLVALFLLLGLSIFYDIMPALHRLPLLLLVTVLTLLTAQGLGCLLAIAKVRFRDIRHLTPLFMQALFYATPVVWTPALLSPRWRMLMELNPLYGLCTLFRYSLLEGPLPSFFVLGWNVVGCLSIALAGNIFFSHFEAKVIDRE